MIVGMTLGMIYLVYLNETKVKKQTEAAESMCSLALNIMREAGWVEMVWVGLSDDNHFHFIFSLFGFAISVFRRFPQEN